jgi:hypothetical protein
MTMNTTNIVRVQPADAFPHVRPSKRERLTYRVNKEILCENVFIAMTIGMAAFLSYMCYHALQNYGAL